MVTHTDQEQKGFNKRVQNSHKIAGKARQPDLAKIPGTMATIMLQDWLDEKSLLLPPH